MERELFAGLRAMNSDASEERTAIQLGLALAWPRTALEISGLGVKCSAGGRQGLSAPTSETK